ncbi:MAG: hypothetical protein ACOC8O_00945 [Natronomonas sp.]
MTAEQTVFEQINIGLGHKEQYDQGDLLELLAHCWVADDFANGGAKTCWIATGDHSRLNTDRQSPRAKVLGHHLRELQRDAIVE